MRFRPVRSLGSNVAISLALNLVVGAAVGNVAIAATISVDSTADASDADPGDGTCASATDGCTLRAAIEETNALRGRDTIVLPAGTYTLNQGSPPNGATLTIMDDLQVLGAGAASTVIDGAGLYRVLHVWLRANLASLPASRVLIRDVTIANGNGVVGPNSGIVAAGIWNQARLTLEDCVVRNHNGHIGSAIVNQDSAGPVRHPRLTMRNTVVRNNVSQTNGAGMTVGQRARAMIEGCVFSDNQAGAYGYGGAVATGHRSKLVVTDSQFVGNSASGGGGALSIAGAAEIADTTISGNTTAGSGGGILRAVSEDDDDDGYYPPGKLKLVNTTITGNRADSDDSGSQFGGGVMSGFRGLVRIGGTISGNFGTSGASDDCTCFQ